DQSSNSSVHTRMNSTQPSRPRQTVLPSNGSVINSNSSEALSRSKATPGSPRSIPDRNVSIASRTTSTFSSDIAHAVSPGQGEVASPELGDQETTGVQGTRVMSITIVFRTHPLVLAQSRQVFTGEPLTKFTEWKPPLASKQLSVPV